MQDSTYDWTKLGEQVMTILEMILAFSAIAALVMAAYHLWQYLEKSEFYKTLISKVLDVIPA